MNFEIIPIVAITVPIFALVIIVRIISDNKVKHKLLDKGTLDEVAAKILSYNSNRFSSPKWGFILVAVGFAFLLIEMYPRTFDDAAALGLLFIASGVALFAHYFLAPKFENKD